jgi:hypothetical protein
MAGTAPEVRQAAAMRWLDAGLADLAVAQRLQSRYGVSRATAYRDLQVAHEAVEASDDGPTAAEAQDAGSGAHILSLLVLQFQEADASGDVDAMVKLTRAIDVAKRWRGTGGPDAWHG